MILEVLKYILVVLGIIAVGTFIVWGLVTLILRIVEPNGNQNVSNEFSNRQVTYENYQQKLITSEDVKEEVKEEPGVNETVFVNEEAQVQEEDLQDVDLDKAKEEEEALNSGSSFEQLEDEEKEFMREKQRLIEERFAAKAKEQDEVDEIFVDDDSEEDSDEDIEALINKILEEDDSQEETLNEENEFETEVQEETGVLSKNVQGDDYPREEVAPEETAELEEAVAEDVVQDQQLEGEEKDQKIKELEEELARQREEFENKIRQMEQEREGQKPTGSLEEYEARLEVLKERLKANEKELKLVKKDFIPLYRINKTLERDNDKLRRKEALVAKQKVVLYGVNNYVDIDEERAKKLSEDLDLLDGLRLSVQHCEEVMKENADRYPVLESSYNSLMATNANIKDDIKECTEKIEALKQAEDSDDE